jgi:hypothetical protein
LEKDSVKKQDDDYKKKKAIVRDEKCEAFFVWPREIWDNGIPQKWDDDNLQKNPAPELAVKKN